MQKFPYIYSTRDKEKYVISTMDVQNFKDSISQIIELEQPCIDYLSKKKQRW